MRQLLAGVCVLIMLAALAAGQEAASADPITGKWGADGLTLLDLSMDAKGAVAGTIFVAESGEVKSSGPIASGSYDRDTRRLTLSGEIKHPKGHMIPYRIVAVLEGETLEAKYRFDTEEGSISLVRVKPKQP